MFFITEIKKFDWIPSITQYQPYSFTFLCTYSTDFSTLFAVIYTCMSFTFFSTSVTDISTDCKIAFKNSLCIDIRWVDVHQTLAGALFIWAQLANFLHLALVNRKSQIVSLIIYIALYNDCSCMVNNIY